VNHLVKLSGKLLIDFSNIKRNLQKHATSHYHNIISSKMSNSPADVLSTSLSFDNQEGTNIGSIIDAWAPSIFGSPTPPQSKSGYKRKSSTFSSLGGKEQDASASKRLSIQRPTCLLSLPVELKIKIIKFSDPNSSVCLGLTCKELYEIHWEEHEIVPLTEYHNGFWIHELLASWASPLVARVIRTRRIMKVIFQNQESDESKGKDFWRA